MRNKTLRRMTLTGLVAAAIVHNNYDHIRNIFTEDTHVEEANDSTAAAPAVSRNDIESIVSQYRLPQNVADYVSEHVDDALDVQAAYGVPAAAALAKAGVESGWGTSDKARQANNHFGIKFKDQFANKYPDCVNLPTWETVNGKTKKTTACFTKFKDDHESYLHFGEFLKEREINGRHPYAAVFKHSDAEGFLRALAETKYSTDTKEMNKTLQILHDYRLKEIVSRAAAVSGSGANNHVMDNLVQKTDSTCERFNELAGLNSAKRKLFRTLVNAGETSTSIADQFNACYSSTGKYLPATAGEVRYRSGSVAGSRLHPGNKVYVVPKYRK